MSDVIKLLPDSVANQIAAGEVIQRPASVVKELVENAVDAGATSIQVIIKDAGRTLVQVVDNGCGMSPTDARLAFERHSTSKITQANDLFSLHTMGFRGEALASIAAVAQVELITMKHGETLGTRIKINGSVVDSQEPIAAAAGSNMMVKNLFFNVPARRKFLKKDSVEFNNIAHEFERLALVNPDRELLLIHNDAVIHQLLKGSLKQRIGSLFGKAVERQLIPVETETSLVKISGFVGLPENARKRGALQYFFVNGRNMRHPYFHKAVIHCYEQLIRPDEQPNYFLSFDVDPATIDVNIHPTKNEIKFENEQPIWQILVAAIKESLGRFNAVPAIDFDMPDAPELPAFCPDASAVNSIDIQSDYNPFDRPVSKVTNIQPVSRPSVINTWRRDSGAALEDWDKLYENFRNSTEPVVDPPLSPQISDPLHSDVPSHLNFGDSESVSAPSLMQLKNHYILSQSKKGLMIVDQHRAHVRILYDKFMAVTDTMPSQKVIFPEVIVLSAAENVVLCNIMDDIRAIGFELSYIGDNSWAVNGIPSVDGLARPVELVRSIISDLSEGIDVTRENVRQKVALNLAHATAIPAGRQLSSMEMEHLLSDLFCVATPLYTPDGQRVVTEIDMDEFEKLFTH